MPKNRVSGTIYFKVNGLQENAKGNFTYNLGREKRESMVGADGVHGYKGMPQAAFIEGEITDRGDLDLAAFVELDGVTITLELANGKTVVLPDAWYVADGTVGSDEANIQVRFEARAGNEV